MIGGMVETNLAATAAVHFALAEGNIRFRDLDLGTEPEAQVITDGGSFIENGDRFLSDPETPGLGIRSLNERKLLSVRIYIQGKGGEKRGEPV